MELRPSTLSKLYSSRCCATSMAGLPFDGLPFPQKNRHIEAKLTDTRLALEHKTAECGSLHERISELDVRLSISFVFFYLYLAAVASQAETGGLRTLVSQLEQDVLLGSSQPTAPQSQATTVKGSFQVQRHCSSIPQSSPAHAHPICGTQITVGDVGLERAAALTQSSPIAPDGTVHDSSVLSVVSGQRDRFRTKVQQLEEENSQLKASVNIQATINTRVFIYKFWIGTHVASNQFRVTGSNIDLVPKAFGAHPTAG